MTTKDLGTELREIAPVEEIIFFSSIFTPGRETADEPVAITIFLYYMKFFFPWS